MLYKCLSRTAERKKLNGQEIGFPHAAISLEALVLEWCSAFRNLCQFDSTHEHYVAVNTSKARTDRCLAETKKEED